MEALAPSESIFREDGWLRICPLVIPVLPPSTNNMYFNLPRGGRKATPKLEKFKRDFREAVVRDPVVQKVLPRLDRSLPYEVQFYFFFPLDEVVTTTYGKKGGAKSRYKKMDTDGRIKAVQDCLALALDIDDSQFFDVVGRKRSSSLTGGQPQIQVWIRPLDPTSVGL